MHPPDSRIALLLDLLDEAFDKKSWHGPNLRGSIRGVSAREAAWHPGPEASQRLGIYTARSLLEICGTPANHRREARVLRAAPMQLFRAPGGTEPSRLDVGRRESADPASGS